MTIASAINEIAVAQGGAASKGGSISAAIDALNDALAGSDQAPARDIEGAIKLLGEHIGGGSTPTGTITITENGEGIDVAQYAYADVNVSGGGYGTVDWWIEDYQATSGYDNTYDDYIMRIIPQTLLTEEQAQALAANPSVACIVVIDENDIISRVEDWETSFMAIWYMSGEQNKYFKIYPAYDIYPDSIVLEDTGGLDDGPHTVSIGFIDIG